MHAIAMETIHWTYVIISEKQIDLEYQMKLNHAEKLNLHHIPLLTTITEDMRKIMEKKCG